MNKKNKKLSVRLYGKEIGVLEERLGKMRFKYNENAHVPLSLSLPIKDIFYSEKACKGYFGGLLPESADTRKIIAMQNKINANNDFALLAAIGRDCAGAVSFHSIGEPEKDEKDLLIDGDVLSDEELEKHIFSLPKKPLSLGRKLSLAGAQEKTAVSVINGKIALAKTDSPTTHILKPAIKEFKQSVANEYICMKTAKECGIDVPKVEIRKINETEFFLIERYDRVIDANRIRRLQQEDFAQALGIWSNDKYEVTFKDCAKVLMMLSKPAISKAQFVEQVVFNYLIGNCDAHGKNFSLIYKENGEIEISPAYDILCTCVYEDLDSFMAMKIGKTNIINEVTLKDWHLFAKQLDISPNFVEKILIKQSKKIPNVLEKVVKEVNIEIGNDILEFITQNCRKFQSKLNI
jgi:serine/threonine-protein kinase HipA